MNNEARVSTWKESALSRRTLVEELASLIRPAMAAVAIAIAFPILCVLVGAFPSLEAIRNAFLFFLLPVGLIALPTALIYRLRNDFAEPMPEYDHGDALSRMNVLIRLAVEGHQYGEDKGELTLVDGWLVFEGERTTFSLAPHDVSAILRGPLRSGREPVGLVIKSAKADVHLWTIAEDPHRDLRRFLECWSVETVPTPSISILPPLEPMPGGGGNRFLRQASSKDVGVRSALIILVPIYVLGVANMHAGVTRRHSTVLLAFSILLALTFGVSFWVYRHFVRNDAFARLAAANKALIRPPMKVRIPQIPRRRASEVEGETQTLRH